MKPSDFKNKREFENVFAYMDFCCEHHFTADNSLQVYDEENGITTLYYNLKEKKSNETV